jgi:hypothetical protein
MLEMRESANGGGLLWLLGIYVQDVKRVLELVHNLHPPFPIWLKLAVQTLQGPASHDRCFMPCGMFIRQFLAHEIEFGAVVVDVEKVPRHGKESRDAGTSSRKLSCGLPPITDRMSRATRLAAGPLRVKRVILILIRRLLVYPDKQTSSEPAACLKRAKCGSQRMVKRMLKEVGHQSGNPTLRRFSAITFSTAGEKTIACLNFDTVKSG